MGLDLRFIILLQLISKLHLVYSQSSVHHNDSKVSFFFFLFLIWMCTFQTDNRTFKIKIMTVDQCSPDCCSGVLIQTLSKYLSEKLYHYTYHDFFFRIHLIAISLFVTYWIHVSSSGGRKSSFFTTDAGQLSPISGNSGNFQ